MNHLKVLIVLFCAPFFSTCSIRDLKSEPTNSKYTQQDDFDFEEVDTNKDSFIYKKEIKAFKASEKKVNSKDSLLVISCIIGSTLLVCFGHQVYVFFSGKFKK